MKKVNVKNLEQLGRAMRELKIVANPKKLQVIDMCNELTRKRLDYLKAVKRGKDVRVSFNSFGTANLYCYVRGI